MSIEVATFVTAACRAGGWSQAPLPVGAMLSDGARPKFTYEQGLTLHPHHSWLITSVPLTLMNGLMLFLLRGDSAYLAIL